MEALTSLIHEDATQSMPPFDLWLRGRDDIFAWWFGPGIGCHGSRVIPTVVGERLAGVRPVQAERRRATATSRGRCRCSRSRTAGSSSSRSSSTPRRCSRCSACPPARRVATGLVRQDVAQAHEGDQLEQLVRRVAQADRQPRRRAASWSRASASTVTASASTPLDVAAERRRRISLEQRADAVAEPGQVRTAIGPRWQSDRRGSRAAIRKDLSAAKTHRCRDR